MYMATRTRTDARKPRPFRWTRAWLARLPSDGNRYEVLDGVLLVTPQARLAHQHVAALLSHALADYCRKYAIGIVVGPGAVLWDDNELQPDVQVIPISAEQARTAEWETAPLPILVVEILSPGSERHDRYKKRDAYMALGIPEYWIVDITARRVLVSTPGTAEPIPVADVVRWHPESAASPLEIPLAALFG